MNIPFDESRNKQTQVCEMDVYVIYWNSCNKQVKVFYRWSEFLGHATKQR